tara:strand:+ start:552 stop:1097 length:546 start_codon:yes stop_codon:yes gene_type:complete
MLRNLLIILFSILALKASAENKDKIVKKLKDTDNLNFQFEQNINGKIDNGVCTIEYPKKIYCEYSKNGKLLVSNGKSLVIKTLSSYYRYPLEKTPLNLILNKSFLINKIYDLNEKIIDQSYINYTITDNENKIDIFFDIENFNLIGWQTNDIYQNSTLTLLSSISINKKIDKNLFILPTQN